MIQAIGIDLVDTERIKGILQTYGDRFVRRVLGPWELQRYTQRADRHLFLAGRFAAKEAAIKALGRYLTSRPALTSIQVINEPSGQPVLRFDPEVMSALGTAKALVSLSHDRAAAIAIVIIVEEQ